MNDEGYSRGAAVLGSAAGTPTWSAVGSWLRRAAQKKNFTLSRQSPKKRSNTAARWANAPYHSTSRIAANSPFQIPHSKFKPTACSSP